MDKELKRLGAVCVLTNDCACANKVSYTYTLPIKIEEKFADFMLPIGKSSFSMKDQRIFKIENRLFSIMAISRFKQIKLVLKQPCNIVKQFEELLVKYLVERIK